MASAFFEQPSQMLIENPPLGVIIKAIIPGTDKFTEIQKHASVEHFPVKVVNAISIENRDLQERYELTKQQMIRAGVTPNETILYHTTHTANLREIVKKGIDPRLANPGTLGRASYFAGLFKSFLYSKVSGLVHIALRVKVLLGNTYMYNIQRDGPGTSIVREPIGYNSIMINLEDCNEYAIYQSFQFYITEIVTYIVSDVYSSLLPIGNYSFSLTTPIKLFFVKLIHRANVVNPNSIDLVKTYIYELVSSQITVATLLQKLYSLLHLTAPENLQTNLSIEITKCTFINNEAPVAAVVAPVAAVVAPVAAVVAPIAAVVAVQPVRASKRIRKS